METIWLQRSSPDVPWGFRLVGGREFGMPLAVQRVTPGSVAAAGIGPGDVVLKVGNVQTSNLEHNDVMDLVKQAGNILQLTIRKDPTGSVPLSPVSGQVSDPFDSGYKTSPRRGSNSSITMYTNNASPNYSTTPRNYGSQHQQPVYGTRIEIQRVNPSPPQPRQPPQRSDSYNNEHFPDYTIAYKSQDPVHDSPGGPVNLRGSRENLYGNQGQAYNQPQNAGYGSMSLPRGVGGYNNSAADRDPYSGSGGPPAYEPKSYNSPQQSVASPNYSNDTSRVNGFSTGVPYQSSQPKQQPQQQQQHQYQPQQQQRQQPQQPQQQYQSQQVQPQVYHASPVTQSYQQPAPTYNGPQSYPTTPVSPQSFSSPMSPRGYQPNAAQTGYSNSNTIDRRQAPSPIRSMNSPSANIYQSQPSPAAVNSNDNYRNGSYDQSNIHGSGGNTYATLPHTKPPTSFNTSVSNNNAMAPTPSTYNSKPPQPFSSPKPFSPGQQPASNSSVPGYSPIKFNKTATPFSPSVHTGPKPFQSPMSPGGPMSQSRRVSFDQGAQDASINQRHHHMRSPPPPEPLDAPSPYSSSPGYNYNMPPGVSDFGGPLPPQPSYSRQSSRGADPYGPSPYSPPSGLMSPRSDAGSGFGYGSGYGSNQNRGYNPASVSASMDNLNLSSPAFEPPPPPPAPALPPPPPLPSGPFPGGPRINSWSPTPYRRPDQFEPEENHENVPDKLLNQMIKSSKSGGPKPFSYGIDMQELKKKMGPPTAPKPRRGKPPSQQAQQQQRQDDPDEFQRVGPPKKPAGHVQSDYFMSRDEGPRGQIDDSPIHISMGSNPKKQSKSFKVLQWMTETEHDDTQEDTKAEGEEAAPKARPKKQRSPTQHNSDDDEMRFSGLHSKQNIPSKTFGRLKKMSSVDRETPTQNGQRETLRVADDAEGVGEYDEASIRYKGKHIPSPSFRVLQNWADNDPDNLSSPAPGSTTKGDEEEDDGLPDTLITEDMVDKRYKGGNIPSKVFKTLQKIVGDDTPEVAEPVAAEPATPPPPPPPEQEPEESGDIPEEIPIPPPEATQVVVLEQPQDVPVSDF